jgi:xanthine/uracil/vitamin C permease (AzgA family)
LRTLLLTLPPHPAGIFTGGLMVLLMMKDVKASILIGILFCTFISWIPTHAGAPSALLIA